MSDRTVEQFLGECLAALGAHRTYGPRPLGDLEHIPVADPLLARLLADADGRLGTAPGVAWLDDQVLRLSSRPGGTADLFPVADPLRLAAALGTWTVGEVHATREYRVDLDLAAPVSPDVEPLRLDESVEMYTLHPSLAEMAPMVLAGPGVVRTGQVGALGSFAHQSGAGVLNTWGAKGVLRWDSALHLGTAGLQARDFELAGFHEAGLVIAVGVDGDEVAGALGDHPQVLEVQPESLASLAFGWPEPTGEPDRPRLYTELAATLAPEYASDDIPLRPARAAADLAAARPDGGLVVADPGPAGLWVARAFPTTEPGSVVVPATVAPGFAAAAALVAGLQGREVVAVTTGPVDDTTRAVLDLAGDIGVPVVLEVWGADGALENPGARVERLQAAMASGVGTTEIAVPVDFERTQVLVEVAGPVVAWTHSDDGEAHGDPAT